MKHRPVAATFVVLALVASAAAVPSHARAAEDVVEPSEAVQARVMLPVRFDIDPVAKTLEAVALPGLEQSLDAGGDVVGAVEAPFELTTAPLASPVDDLPPECSPSTTSTANFTVYPPRYATREKERAYFLQYMFQTNQRDFARRLSGNQDTRQFMECVAGGGRTFTNHEQTVNGGGSTMEDTATSLLLNGMNWGKGEDPTGVKATLAFKVEKDPVSVTASIDGFGGSGYAGSQGPDENAYYLNPYANNQVNGDWKAGFANATEAYKGNVSLALWEYSMSDTVNRLTTIRNQAWMVYQCGNPWRFLNKCTVLDAAPAFDGPEITPQEQTTNSAGSARWDVMVPQDPQNATTLAFDYGDGTPESRVTIPMGSGASTFAFSRTFSGTGTYPQRATIVETGASDGAVTVHPDPTDVGIGGGGAWASGPLVGVPQVGTLLVTGPGSASSLVVGAGPDDRRWCKNPTESVEVAQGQDFTVTVDQATAGMQDGCPTAANAPNQLPEGTNDVFVNNGDAYEWNIVEGYWDFTGVPGDDSDTAGCWAPGTTNEFHDTMEVAADGSGQKTFTLSGMTTANPADGLIDDVSVLCVGAVNADGVQVGIFAPFDVTSI